MENGDRIDFTSAVPKSWDDPALIITIDRAFSMSGGCFLAATLAQETTTASGRKGKPKHLIKITVPEDEGMVSLLRSLMTCFDQGTVEIGASYPAADRG